MIESISLLDGIPDKDTQVRILLEACAVRVPADANNNTLSIHEIRAAANIQQIVAILLIECCVDTLGLHNMLQRKRLEEIE